MLNLKFTNPMTSTECWKSCLIIRQKTVNFLTFLHKFVRKHQYHLSPNPNTSFNQSFSFCISKFSFVFLKNQLIPTVKKIQKINFQYNCKKRTCLYLLFYYIQFECIWKKILFQFQSTLLRLVTYNRIWLIGSPMKKGNRTVLSEILVWRKEMMVRA